MKMLILDDDPAMGALVRRIAERIGFVADAVTRAVDFRAACEASPPELVVLDLQIGEEDGIEQLRYLADNGYRVPIILISGHDRRVLGTARQLGGALGLDIIDALNKPLRAADLRATLERVGSTLRPLSPQVLLEAIRDDQFRLEYQPIVSRNPRKVLKLEALVRWNHPSRGLIPPDQFIPMAELHAEVIDALTEWVVREAAHDYHVLREKNLAVPIAVNVSAVNLHRLDFPDRMHAIVQGARIPDGEFSFEITEGTATRDPTQMMDVLGRLRLKGIDLSIDDFGMGYSSLLQLRQLPYSELKIDKSFIMDVTRSRDSLAVVRSVIDLARNMDMISIAEGVETEETAVLVESLGATGLQGYLIGRPMGIEQVAIWLRDWMIPVSA